MLPFQHILIELLDKQARGTISREEEEVLFQWYDSFNVPEELTFVSTAEKEATGTVIMAGIAGRLTRHEPAIEQAVPRRGLLRYAGMWKAAAVVFLLLWAAMLYYYIYNAGGNSAIAYTEVKTARGGAFRQVTLPDSSLVWLAPGSTLRYPVYFRRKERLVELPEGMAFFSVTKDAAAPFTVVTHDSVKTQVLGTTFTIKAWQALPGITVSVASGKVQVTDAAGQREMLHPGEQVVYSRQAKQFRKSTVDTQDIKNVVQGEVVLSNASMDEIVTILSVMYNVTISYDREKMKDYRFNIRLSHHLTLVEVLDILQSMGGIRYTITGNGVFLSSQ